jgi:iron complex transport system ATP-binding protein
MPSSGPASRRLYTLSEVHYRYAESTAGLHGVSIGIRPASLVAVIGENGSGKSTLLRVIAGMLTPSSGAVLSGDGTPFERDRTLARRIAYVPQTHDIVFPFRVIDVVLTGRSPHIPRFRFETARDRAIAMESLAEVGAAHLAGRRVTEISAGERQLVSIARALAQRPECLLLDEPTAALDLTHRWRVVRLLKRLRSKEGLTTVFVTHDLDSIDAAFDQVVALRRGRVVVSGTPETVFRRDVLRRVYDDPTLELRRVDGRTLLWSRSDP